jgi:hypothetical protein
MAERKSKETLAQENLDLAVRVLEKAKARKEKTAADADAANLAYQDAQRKHVFATESPYLPQNNQEIDASVHGADEDEAARAAKAQELAAQVNAGDDGSTLL